MGGSNSVPHIDDILKNERGYQVEVSANTRSGSIAVRGTVDHCTFDGADLAGFAEEKQVVKRRCIRFDIGNDCGTFIATADFALVEDVFQQSVHRSVTANDACPGWKRSTFGSELFELIENTCRYMGIPCLLMSVVKRRYVAHKKSIAPATFAAQNGVTLYEHAGLYEMPYPKNRQVIKSGIEVQNERLRERHELLQSKEKWDSCLGEFVSQTNTLKEMKDKAEEMVRKEVKRLGADLRESEVNGLEESDVVWFGAREIAEMRIISFKRFLEVTLDRSRMFAIRPANIEEDVASFTSISMLDEQKLEHELFPVKVFEWTDKEGGDMSLAVTRNFRDAHMLRKIRLFHQKPVHLQMDSDAIGDSSSMLAAREWVIDRVQSKGAKSIADAAKILKTSIRSNQVFRMTAANDLFSWAFTQQPLFMTLVKPVLLPNGKQTNVMITQRTSRGVTQFSVNFRKPDAS